MMISTNKSTYVSVSWFVSPDPAAAGFKLWLICLGVPKAFGTIPQRTPNISSNLKIGG